MMNLSWKNNGINLFSLLLFLFLFIFEILFLSLFILIPHIFIILFD